MIATARLQRKRLVQRHGDAGNAQKENGVSPSSRETVHGNHLFTDSKECKRVDDFDNRTLLKQRKEKKNPLRCLLLLLLQATERKSHAYHWGLLISVLTGCDFGTCPSFTSVCSGDK
jgi:hypothetical protein